MGVWEKRDSRVLRAVKLWRWSVGHQRPFNCTVLRCLSFCKPRPESSHSRCNFSFPVTQSLSYVVKATLKPPRFNPDLGNEGREEAIIILPLRLIS